MGIAVNLTDAVTAKLNETTFGTATVERQLSPKVVRKGTCAKDHRSITEQSLRRAR